MRKSKAFTFNYLVSLVLLVMAMLMPYITYADEDTLSMPETPGSWDPIVEQIDYLIALKFYDCQEFTTDKNALNICGYQPWEVPTFPDSVYRQRIAKLNNGSTFEFVYNDDVRRYIDLYANRKREQMGRMLGLAALYFPLFEEFLDKYEMPLELKYLAVVESALNPIARSRAGAKGLWQFMYKTGKMYDLESTTLIDDRFDPILSTDAACRHMIDLYEVFGDWAMVLAAYNCGSGNVSRAIKRSGGKTTYWELQPYLPLETRGYVPAFIAVAYTMTYASQHNLFPVHPGFLDSDIDTFNVKGTLSFEQISAHTGIPVNHLDLLNPAYVRGIIPATATDQMTIRIPAKYTRAFLAVEDSIYMKKGNTPNEVVVNSILSEDRKVYHYVRSGESLGVIAKKYGCSVNDVKEWNNLRGTTIHPRQRLVIHLKPKGTETAVKTAPAKETRDPNATYHTVKPGETLSVIAAAYDCSAEDIRQWNKLEGNLIKTGQSLRVKPATVETSAQTPPATAATPAPSTSKVKLDSKYVYHTVRRGDTLWAIAKLYEGVSVEDIKQVNNINSDKSLKPGQKLRIPSKG